ncbi:MAG: pilus assembly protein TadG-related protein [Nitriliruptorales bacterium]
MTPGSESGSLTIWMLGLCVAVLFLGGLSLDLWRGFLERRELAGAVDAAVIAAASVLDESEFRSSATPELEVDAARAVACDYLRERTSPPVGCEGIVVTPTEVSVTATRSLELTLLRVLLWDEPDLVVRVTARAAPRLGG